MTEDNFEGLEELIKQTIMKRGDYGEFVFHSVLTLVKLLDEKNVVDFDEYIGALKTSLTENLEQND